MAQTGQTDKYRQVKGTWWSVTAFSQNEIDELSGTVYPEWVSKVHGGLEMCPKTNRLHFQGAIQARRSVRFSQVKHWVATAHIELARDRNALKKYVMKAETAVGEKVVNVNETPYYRPHELLRKIAIKRRQTDRQTEEGFVKVNPKSPAKAAYWHCVKEVLKDDPTLISAFMNPALEKAWVGTSEFWINEEVAEQLVLLARPSENKILEDGINAPQSDEEA